MQTIVVLTGEAELGKERGKYAKLMIGEEVKRKKEGRIRVFEIYLISKDKGLKLSREFYEEAVNIATKDMSCRLKFKPFLLMERSGGKEKGKRRSKKKIYDKNWFVVYGLRILGVSKEKINSIMNILHELRENQQNG